MGFLDFLRHFLRREGKTPPDQGGSVKHSEEKQMLKDRETRSVAQVSDALPSYSKDRSFEKKLRWQIKDAAAETVRWTITPEKAALMLEWNDRNRPLTEKKIKNYAAVMASGGWRYNGVPIIFSKRRLIDGQHRLHACIASKVSIDSLMVFGAPDDAFDTIDIGKTRTASDIFSIHGVSNANLCSAGAKWVYQYENNQLSPSGGGIEIEHKTLHAFFLENQGIGDSVWIAYLLKKNKLAMPSIIMAIHYIASRKHKRDADEFFRKVGDGLGFTGKKDPAYRLHHRLIENATSQEKLGRKQIAALTIKAWNAHRLGRDVGTLKYSADETFPKVI